MKTGIVIFYQDEIEYTTTTVCSLVDSTAGFEDIALINNSSSECLPNRLKQYVRIANTESFSFSRLCNQAIGLMLTNNWDAVAICNNDLIFTPGWLEPLKKRLGESSVLGALSPEVLALGPPERPGERPEGYVATAKKYVTANEGRYDINMLYGPCFILKRELALDVGLFDENYKRGYWEDVDYMKRIKETNWITMVCHDSAIFHFGGRTLATGPNYYEENKRYFEKKWNIKLPEKFSVRCCRVYDESGKVIV